MLYNLYPKVFVLWTIMSYKHIMSFKLMYVVQHIVSFERLCCLTLYVA